MKDTGEYNATFSDLFEKIEKSRKEQPSAGTKFRLMGLAADIMEMVDMMQHEVLDVVSREAVLEADADIDYTELSERLLMLELPESGSEDAIVCEQTRLVNEALGMLSSVLLQIADQLERRHKDEEYARLYEAEKRRYMNSGTARRSRQTFEQWKEFENSGNPALESVEDYRMEKLLKMFEKGVLASRVEHIQRAKRYPGEVDFDQLDDDHKMKHTAHRYYAALRKLVDFKDGCLVVDPVRVGRHFYTSRHEENAKANRTSFLKYMHKVELAQEEYRRLLSTPNEAEEVCPLPDVLATEEAMEIREKLREAGWVNEDWQPADLSGSERGLVARAVCERLEINEVWQVFGQLWGEKPETLRGYFNKALGQRKTLLFQDKLKKILG